MIAIIGGGDIATRGIAPIVGGTVFDRDACDATDPGWVHAVLTALPAPLDAVIYTAGISTPATVTESDPRAWRREIEINTIGAYHVARAAIAAGAMRLVFIASIAGLYGKPNHSGYSASKAALISLTQSLAMEGHAAYAISPGRVDTAMRERDYPGEDPRTRLDPQQIGRIVDDILTDRYQPGDNIVIRMRGHRVLPLAVHTGDGWRQKLRVGNPITV